MGKLRPNWTGTGVTSAGGSVAISIPNNNGERVWIVEQIAINYPKAGDTPTVSIYLNGQLQSGPAQMIPVTNGLGQTFAGQPYLHIEVDDNLQVQVQGGTSGVSVSVQVQYRTVSYGHDELEGRY